MPSPSPSRAARDTGERDIEVIVQDHDMQEKTVEWRHEE